MFGSRSMARFAVDREFHPLGSGVPFAPSPMGLGQMAGAAALEVSALPVGVGLRIEVAGLIEGGANPLARPGAPDERQKPVGSIRSARQVHLMLAAGGED